MPRRLPLGWWQYTPGQPEQLWCLEVSRETSGFIAETKSSKSDADDLAVLVSVADDVEAAFGATRDDPTYQLPPFRAITKVSRPHTRPPHRIENAGQAADIAFVVMEGIRQARAKFQPQGRVHFFMAVPVGLAVLIGQLLNTLGQVQTYEHEPEGVVGLYRPGVTLTPAI